MSARPGARIEGQPREIGGVAGLESLVGQHLGYSEWHEVSQPDVDQFGALTGDRQWIHVDPVRANAGPFGGPIVHGFFTLSLLPMLKAEIFEVRGTAFVVNYGLDRVRFPMALPVGTPVRGGAELLRVERGGSGIRAVFLFTIEGDGLAKPVCVAEMISLISEGSDG